MSLDGAKNLEGLRGRDFISTTEFTRDELQIMLDGASAPSGRPLEGKSVGLLFFNPSLRTRISFELSVTQLGGTPVVLSMGQDTWKLETRDGVVMDEDKAEHIQDAIRVLSRYVDALAVRVFPGMVDLESDLSDHVIRQIQRFATVPVINMESAIWHPCQAMADALTVQQHLGAIDGKKVVLSWAYHPKALPTSVGNSFSAVMHQLGAEVHVARPEGYALPRVSDFSLHETESLEDALEGADVVYAKSWGSLEGYGHWDDELELRERFRDWRIDSECMARTRDALFMHCLPVRRNVVVTDEVIDSERSVVYDQAANRLHVQKSILGALL